jgi:RNA polymerase-binding protein DksA
MAGSKKADKRSAAKSAARKEKPKASRGKPVKAKPAPAKPVASKAAASARPPAVRPKSEPRLDTRHSILQTIKTGARRPTPRSDSREADATELDPADAEKSGKTYKAAVDEEWQSKMRDALVNQRHQLLAVVQTTQAQMAEKTGDLPDLSDRASEGFEDDLAVGLMAIEAAQLEDIDFAISRIDDGSYGLCADCGKPVPRKRLEVLPFARRCLACEGESERRHRKVEEESSEEDSD